MPSDLEDCAYTSPSVTRTDTGDWASLKPMPLLGTLDDTTSWFTSGPSTAVALTRSMLPARLGRTMKGSASLKADSVPPARQAPPSRCWNSAGPGARVGAVGAVAHR